MTNIDVSIILPTVDRANALKRMLCSLEDATKGISYELIILDGDSSDNTLAVIQEFSPIKPQIYSESDCLGTGRHPLHQLFNFGFSKSVGKWVMFASDDIIFNSECISNAVLELNKQKDDVAGGIMFYKDIPVKRDILKDFHINYTYGQFLSPDFALIKSDYFKQSGGFGTDSFFYYTCEDLWIQWYLKGLRFIPLPKCLIEHIWEQDARRISHIKTNKADRAIFFAKWKNIINVNIPLKIIKPEDLC